MAMMRGERFQEARKVSVISLAGNIFLAMLKFIAGFMAGSSAMIADAFHSLSDILSTLVVIVSLKISLKPADPSHPYGHGKAESIGAKILALILIATGLGLAWDGVQNFLYGESIRPGPLALYAALLSIVCKEGMYRYAAGIGKKTGSTAIMADAWHHRSDALSSLAALVGIGGARLGFGFMDPLAAVVVAGMIVRIGIKLATQAIDELMDAAPDEGLQNKFTREAAICLGVKEVGDVRIRANGPDLYVDLTLVVEKGLSALEAHDVAERARINIMKMDSRVQDVFVHVDPEEIVSDSDE